MPQVMAPIRLNKFLAERLGLSRREADDAIVAGHVTVDGQPAVLGTRIDKSSKVCYNSKIVPFEADFLYIMFHKPVGYVCSRRAQGAAPTLYDLLPPPYRALKTVGRLDKDSSGLILLTNDGDFAYQMTHPSFRKTKVYEVELDHPLAPLHQQMISEYGVMLDDGPSCFKVISGWAADAPEGGPPKNAGHFLGEAGAAGPARRRIVEGEQVRSAKKCSSSHYTVIMHEGRNRQIRRTFAALGYRVTRLHRTGFGPYELGDLPSGGLRNIAI